MMSLFKKLKSIFKKSNKEKTLSPTMKQFFDDVNDFAWKEAAENIETLFPKKIQSGEKIKWIK